MFNRDDWLAQVREPIIDPQREIVDPHHHLWDRPGSRYLLDNLHADTGDGHRVVQTVFIECKAGYRTDGPAHLRPVGETQFVAKVAAHSQGQPGQAAVAAIVAHADLTSPALDEILDAHEKAGGGLFRGIRHAGAWDPDPDALTIKPRGVQGQYRDDAFRAGVTRLGQRGLTYDSWHYHHLNGDYYDLARAVPGTTFVLDHFGTPLGVGRFAVKREEIFAQWKDDIAAIAQCPNVVAKLGGMAMPDNGFGWEKRDKPVTSDEFAQAQARYYEHTIACFGPDRCMFESNFPVDRCSVSYHVLYNAFKKIAARYSEAEQQAMFSGTARRVYDL